MNAILLSSRYLPLCGTLQAQLRGMPPPPFSPPSDPAQRLLQGPPAKSNFLAAKSLMKRGSEHQFHKSTTTGPGHTAVYCYFSSLITAHSALFTTSSPSFPRNPLSPALRSGPTAGSGASPKTKLLAAPSTAPPSSSPPKQIPAALGDGVLFSCRTIRLRIHCLDRRTETTESIEPPWQAIKEWIPDDEPDLNWFKKHRLNQRTLLSLIT